MIDFYLSKTGKLTANFNESHIHSGIDPEKEAEKYILNKIKNRENPSLILILFPGLNYLYNILKNYFPDTKIVTIHINDEMYKHSVADNKNNNTTWHPGSGLSLKQFLYNNIREIEVKTLFTVTWEPIIRIFPLEAKKYSEIVEQVLTEYNSNISTTNYFGKKYIKNILKNISLIKNTAVVKNIEKPIIVISSGPTVDHAIKLIKETRDSVFLIALSSSYNILKYNNIKPDIIISTDPGYYASLHINNLDDYSQLISSPLTANFGNNHKNPYLIINQGTFIEDYFLKNSLLPYINIPPNGTVAGSAYFLTAGITKNPVIFAGIDFCANDIKTHCSPHAFENILFKKAERINPLLNIYYNQAITNYNIKDNIMHNCRTSQQLKAYSGWFNTTLIENNYYRLNPSPIEIKNMKPIDNMAAYRIIKNYYINKEISYLLNVIDKEQHIIHIIKLIKQLINNIKTDISDLFYERLMLEYDKNLLFYFNTSKYLDLIDLLLSNSKDILKKRYNNLSEECIDFLKKELEKIEK